MHQGKILSLDTPQRLISRYVGTEVWEIEVNSAEKVETVRELESRGLDFEDTGNRIHVFHIDAEESVRGLENLPERLKRRTATLEDVFLKLTGRKIRE